MRSLVVFRLALGLFAGGVAVASPCKPMSVATTSGSISIVSTETSSMASTASSTADVSATSAMSESSAETSASSEAAASTTIEASIEVASSTTIEASMTTTFAVDSTTAEPTTAEPTTTEGTTTAPMPTFTMFATGESSVEGEGLHTYNNENSVAVFQPNLIFGTPLVLTYTIDAQGRLINDQGFFLCGYYLATNSALDAPASVSACLSDKPKSPFLNCKLSSELDVQCSVPARSCASNPRGGEPICEETGGTWSTWSNGAVFVGRGLMLGPVDTPDTYERIGLRASLV
ncbi:hypothetical protein FPOAC2_07149 [Fusarium poae]|uniref:hypothetical protein n=1 Tax=Fusarium poae TaxID=36050 RepID=UPI001CE831BF|nr:hypothetical protein FPOAC1_007005 [Fusarium poae]KAG8673690.1 hypothetical protein FPOAC1_007005 [Fusarium poae]